MLAKTTRGGVLLSLPSTPQLSNACHHRFRNSVQMETMSLATVTIHVQQHCNVVESLEIEC
jgi:hypothetical protein